MTEKNFLIVNPKGVMHVVTEAHARARLKIIGWRLATPEEKDAYQKANGNQRYDKPLATPFSAEPTMEDALPEVEALATDKTETVADAVAPIAKGKRVKG